MASSVAAHVITVLTFCLLAACSKPAPDSEATRAEARRIADEKVPACALAKTGSKTGMTYITDARSEGGWLFEYEGDARLCEVWVGDDGKVEIDPPTP